MAYDKTKLVRMGEYPIAGFNSSMGVGLAHWAYRSADADTTVSGAGYITNAADLGMQIGDIVWVAVTSAGVITDVYGHIVTAISAVTAPGVGGAATLSSTTVPHMN